MHDYVTETVDGPLRNSAVGSLEPGSVVDGRYRVLRVLGYGGSAIVYAVHDLKLRQDVALKMLRADRISETAIKRLRREVAIARSAADPHLIRIFEIVESAGGTYLTMELFDAPTLRASMKDRALDIEAVVAMGSEILQAIAALHRLGIVHRDIKPSNILIAANGDIKLADFGLALHVDRDESRVTQTAGIVGTLEYLSPEQALGKEIDQRSDLYSFGVLLFEMLSGTVPFRSESSIGTVVAHINRAAPDVRKLRRDAPRWLARVIARLLEKEPSRRFSNADEVLTALRRRRLPLAPSLSGMRVAIAAVAIGLFGTAFAYESFMHRFARVVNDGAMTIQALDRAGRPLWSMSRVQQFNNLVYVHQGGTLRWIGLIQDHGQFFDLAHNHDLLLIDPQSGHVDRRVRLPSAETAFPDFSADFHANGVAATTLDGTGDDVVVVSYCHHIYWPSYTVLYDPRSQTAGTLFIGSGHHRYAGAVDVNGDGRKDIILAGINNRMGWSVAVAAIDVRSIPSGFDVVSSPDAEYAPSGSAALLWYALLPAGAVRGAAVDTEKRQIIVNYLDGHISSVGFDGFTPAKYRAPLRSRDQSRRAAYQGLRDALRLAAGGFRGESVEASSRARAYAAASEDRFLTDWVTRSRAAILARAGRTDEADREFEAAVASSSSPSEVAFDAGKTFHLAGSLERAVAWYHRGLGNHSTGESGRGRYEFVEGEILALGELNRWDDAMRAVDRYRDEFYDWPYPIAFRQYIQWRRGEKIESPVDVHGTTTDLLRYWNLEILYRNGMNRPALLNAIDAERSASSGDTLLLSLRAEVLADLGRAGEAYTDARKSFEEAVTRRRSDTEVRAHFDLIAARFIRLARATKHLQSAHEAEAQLRMAAGHS